MKCEICPQDTEHVTDSYSKDKDYFADALTRLGIKFETQYASRKYPFICDFYLTDYDIYIELNLHWSHNGHFFDQTDQSDLDTLAMWKDKAKNGHKQYDDAISVWVIRDLIKRKRAKQNNLNYVVLWSRQELEFYINYLKEII